MSKTNRKASIILLAVVLIIVAFLGLIGFIADFMWFKEMGYLSVFFKQLTTQLTVGVPTFIVITLLVYLYLGMLRKGYFSQIASSEPTNMKRLKRTTVLLAVVFGIFATVMTVWQLWFDILKFANSTDFDITDPLFNFDISFYIFKLDFLTQLNEIMIGVIIGFIIMTVIYYTVLLTVRTPDVFKETVPPGAENVDGNVYEDESQRFGEGGNAGNKGGSGDMFGKFTEAFTGRRFESRPRQKKQFDDANFKQLFKIASGKIGVLGFIFFIMLGINFFLQQFDLLHSHSGAVYGAGFTDVNITLWKLRILCALSVIAAVLFVVFMKKRQYKKLLTVPVIMIAVGLVGSGAELLVQTVIVSPDELGKESKYIERNIEYTQYAYQLDDVSIKAFEADNSLSATDINENTETINNIRINDYVNIIPSTM